MAMLYWLSFCATKLSQFQGWFLADDSPHGCQSCKQVAAHNSLYTVRASHGLGSDEDAGEGKWLTLQGA